MAKSDKNKKNAPDQPGNHFLKDDVRKKELAQEHKEYLGMNVPDNYFPNFRDNILKGIQMKKEQTKTVFGLQPMIAYPIAALILILIALSVYMPYMEKEDIPKEKDIEVVDNSFIDFYQNEFLVNSLFVEDDEVGQFLDDFVLNEIIVEAELSEQELDNIYINSLFVEDSLIKNYLDQNLIENIVL